MIGVGTGLAMEGRIVYTYSIANFAFMRCLEQIRNDAAYHDANLNVVAVGGGFSYGALGISHHATEDLAIMRSLPGVKVFSPCDDWEAAEATEAISLLPGTSYLRLDRSSAAVTRNGNESYQVGKARLLRAGSDLTIAVTGGIAEEAIKAADILALQGVSCRVLSFHTLKPLDVDALVSASIETGGLLTLEEHSVDGGLGGAAAEALLEAGHAPRFFHRIGLRRGFSSVVGSQSYLRKIYCLDAAAVGAKALEMLQSRAVRSPARAA
jgi:transketolase